MNHSHSSPVYGVEGSSFGEYVTRLFSEDFMPHGHCYLWKPEILWVHVLSDVLIFIAYLSIPFALLVFVRKRRDIPFRSTFLLFSAFIISCGFTHLMSIYTTYHGVYRAEGVLKAITAFFSVLTAYKVWPLIPKALAIPSQSALEDANAKLISFAESLEGKVKDRTEELNRQNEELRQITEVSGAREDRILELKLEINRLSRQLEQDEPYPGLEDLQAPGAKGQESE